MKDFFVHKPEKTGASDPVLYYVLAAAGIIFLYMTLGRYAQTVYDGFLVVPCLLFLGAIREPGTGRDLRNVLLLPAAMMVWFLLLQIRRGSAYDELYNAGLFLSAYLFAFPMASMLRDGDAQKALKIFAGAYLAAAAVLAAEGVLLVLDCLPGFLSEDVCWDGARLQMVWHPNIAGCFLMIGIILGTGFVSQARSRWAKLGLCAVIALILGAMALTNCRTAILLTGGYLGSLLFFRAVKHGRIWFLLGVLSVLVVTAAVYLGAGRLYQANQELLIRKYTQQYSQQLQGDSQEETLPIKIDAETGEVRLTSGSPQGGLEKDFGTLNSRTQIWSSALLALRESRALQIWGIGNPGWYVSQYNAFEIKHLHNAWMECLVGMGFVGFAIAAAFTLITLWNSLIILLKHHQDIWKRTVALLVLCLMAASMLEPYLFYTTSKYHLVDFLFFLCAGYLVCWQQEDNRRILAAVRGRIPFLK